MRACSLSVLAVSILLALLSRCGSVTVEAASRDLQGADTDNADDDDDGMDMLELQVRAVNAPPGALDAIVADAAKYMRFLMAAEPTYTEVKPGESVPDDDGDEGDRNRALALALAVEETGAGQEQEEDGGSSTPMIRGAASSATATNNKERSLLRLRSCPTECAKSSSTSCKQVGCAYCGTRCRRRRRERNLGALGGRTATKIEGKINARLLRACGTTQDCVIYAKLYRLRAAQGGKLVEKPVV
jgi:hypothetical protein